MTRPLRIQYPGALYHVIARGNASQRIYLDDNDRRMFLKNLEQCRNIHHLICHAFCLMDNHYHLLLETPDGNLSQIMRDMNGNYTQRFNTKHKRNGHLLQGRYKSFLIEKETYLLEVVRYIILNPVRAGMVDHPRFWKWSSYLATVGSVVAPRWLEIDWTLRLFSENQKEAQKQYQSFVEEGMYMNSPYEQMEEGIVLGNSQFLSWVWENFKNAEEIKEIKTSDRMISRLSLKELFSTAHNKDERNLIIKMAKIRAGYSLAEIARHLGLDRTTVSRIFHS